MGIRVSKQYGVNPSVTCCEICGKDYGVAMFGTGYKDKNGKTARAPHMVRMGLCKDCEGVIKQKGLMVIEVKDGETGKNPYRTGRIVGITKDARERLGVESNVCYMEQSVFQRCLMIFPTTMRPIFELAKYHGRWAVFDRISRVFYDTGKGKKFCKMKVNGLNSYETKNQDRERGVWI